MVTRTSAVRLAVEGIAAYKAALENAGDEGQKALERVGIGAQAANQNIGRLNEGVSSFSRIGRSNLFQNLGYQVNDFAVQVQGGTNKVVAFTQQFSQFIGGFGAAGAILGGVTGALGAAYSVITKLGDASDYAATELGKLTTSTDEYKAALVGLEPLQIAHLQQLSALAAEQEKTAEANRKAAQDIPLAGLGAEGVGMGPLASGLSSAQQFEALIRARNKTLNKEFDAVLQYQMAKFDEYIKKYGGIPTPKGGLEGFRGAQDVGLEKGTDIELQRQKELRTEQERRDNANKASAKSAETLHIANEKLLEQAKLNVEAAQAEADALYMGEDARKRANVERQYEIDLLAAAQPAQKEYSLALIDEANRLRDVKLATIERSRAIEDAQKKIDASPDAGGGGGLGFHGMTTEQAEANRQQLKNLTRDQTKETKEFARIQEEILIEPWKNLATGVSQITTNMFDEMLKKGQVSFDSLAKGFDDLFRTTIAGVMGNIASMPINMALAEIQKNAATKGGDLFGGLQQYGAEHPHMAAAGYGAAGGYAAGTAYGQLTGKEDTYAATGGAIGGAIGAVAGSFIPVPVVGTIAGGIVGAAVGSFIGGMFGGEGLGNDQSVQKFGSKVAKAIWSDKSFSEENRQVTGGIIGQLSQLSEALRATGANINDITLAISAGNKTGIQVQGKGYGTDAEAASVAAIRLLLQNTSGLQGSQVTALKTTKGRNVQEVMDDLAFAREFDKITFSGTAAEAAMRDLTETFDATGRRARALGLDEIALAATRERAMAQLTLAAQRQARDLGAQFQMAIAKTDLERNLIGVNQQFAGLNDQFVDAGYSAENLAKLEGARVAAEGQARAQAAAQARAEAEARKQQAEAAAQQRRQEAEQRKQEAERRKQEAIQAAQQREQERRQRRDFYAQFQTTVAKDPLQQQIIQINNQFAQLRDTMKELGYSSAQYREVEAARQRQVAEVVEQNRRQKRDLYGQFMDAVHGDALGVALRGVNLEFAHLTETLKDASYTSGQLREVEQARQKAIAEAYEQDRRQRRDFNAEFQLATSGSELGNALLNVDMQFAHLTESAKDAGYSVRSLQDIESAHQREREKVLEDSRRQARALGATFFQTVRESKLEKTLAGIDQQFAELADTLKDAGYSSVSLAQLEQARVRAQTEAVEQLRRQAVSMQSDLENKIRGIGSFYDDLIKPLQAVNQNNMLNPAGQIGAARQAFQADLAGAGAKDPEAIRRLAGSSQQFQQLVSQNYGTGGVGGQYLREIQAGLSGTIADLQGERAAALADLPQIVQRTTMDIIRENRADIDRVVAELEGLRTDLRTRGVKFA